MCTFCPQDLWKRAYVAKAKERIRFMSFETFKKVVDWAPPDFYIFFSGFTEPFMNPLCTEMILYAHKKHRFVNIFTTLMGVRLKDMKMLFSKLSFFDDKDGLVLHLPSEDNTERIKVTDEFLEVLDFILASKCQNIELHFHGKEPRKNVQTVLKRYKRQIDYWSLHTRLGQVKLDNIAAPKRLRGKIRCARPGMHAHVVLPDGSVALCCNDFGMKHILGNIFVESYQDIRAGSGLKKVFEGLSNEKADILCRKCHYAMNDDWIAEYFNTPFSSKKIPSFFKLQLLRMKKEHPKIYEQTRQQYRNIKDIIRK
jgi:hypothetical protein